MSTNRDRFALIVKGWRAFYAGVTFKAAHQFRWSPSQEQWPSLDPGEAAAA